MTEDPKRPSTSHRSEPTAREGNSLHSSSAHAPTRTSTDLDALLGSGRLLAGRYRVLSLLGVGGMGMVYRALDQELDLEVAVKVIRPERAGDRNVLDRFRKELILARQVSHPHVVRIHDLGQDEGMYFITMDLVRGRSLRAVIEEGGPMDPQRAVEIAKQLASALGAAHAEGVVHRDLKPANVLIDEAGRAHITDFGVARSMVTAGLTASGSIVGTPDYLSPEQAAGEPVDGRSDLYALGLIFFELLTHRQPFQGRTLAEVVAQRLTVVPRRLRDLVPEAPIELELILQKLLARYPDDRFASAEDLLRALDGETRVQAPIVVRSSRRRLYATIATLAVIAVIAGFWLWNDRASQQAPSTSASVAPVAARYSLAVLPFVDQTGREDLAWTSRGAAEWLAEMLTESADLRVVDSARVFRLLSDLHIKPGDLDAAQLRQLAELVDVDRLITGRVRSEGANLRLELRLLSPLEPERESAEVSVGDVEVGNLLPAVEALAGELRRELALVAAAPETPESQSSDQEALRAYFEGSDRLAAGDALGSVEQLERATFLDPQFTAAWTRLSAAHERSGTPERALDAAEKAVATLRDETSRLAYEARARQARLLGDPMETARLLELLVEHYPNDIEARIALAEAYAEQGTFERADKLLHEVTEANPSHQRAWYLLGKFAILGGSTQQAIDDYLVRALILHNKLGNEQGKADVLNAFGVAYQDLGRLDEATENYQRAVEIRQAIGDRRGLASSLRNLAAINAQKGAYEEADQQLERALALLQEIGDRQGMADLFNVYGLIAEEHGQYRDALDRYRRSIQLWRELGDRRALAEAWISVGFAYYVLGEYDNARAFLQQALDAFRDDANVQGEVQALQALGLLELAQGHWDRAVKSFLETLDTSRRLQLVDETVVALGYLGRIAQLQGRFDAALSSYDQALELLDELGDPRGLVEFSSMKAETRLQIGMLEAAQADLMRAEQAGKSFVNRGQQARLLAIGARLAAATGNLAEARKLQARALREADESQAITPQLEASLAAGLIALQAGDASAAARILGAMAERAAKLGDVPQELGALVPLAAAQLQLARPREAEETARRGLRLIQRPGEYHSTFELHQVLANALSTLGDSDGASAERQAGRKELKRLRRHLDGEARDSFDRLPEVQDLER